MGQTAATDVCNNNILEDNIYSLKMLPVSGKTFYSPKTDSLQEPDRVVCEYVSGFSFF